MNVQTTETDPRGLWVTEKADAFDSVKLGMVDMPSPEPGPGQVLVEVVASAINPSDVKATLGIMPDAGWPRIPGRDCAGIVRKGPAALVGREVWGGGGEPGITRHGAHATHVVLPASAMRAHGRARRGHRLQHGG
jgi:NADPH2:quinone reductase